MMSNWNANVPAPRQAVPAWRLGSWTLEAGRCRRHRRGRAACSKQAAEEVDSEDGRPRQDGAGGHAARSAACVHATGVVTPAPGAELSSSRRRPARIAEIPHADGDRVAAGRRARPLRDSDSRREVQRQAAEVQRAQAALANAKANQTRAARAVRARRRGAQGSRRRRPRGGRRGGRVAQAEASRAAASHGRRARDRARHLRRRRREALPQPRRSRRGRRERPGAARHRSAPPRGRRRRCRSPMSSRIVDRARRRACRRRPTGDAGRRAEGRLAAGARSTPGTATDPGPPRASSRRRTSRPARPCRSTSTPSSTPTSCSSRPRRIVREGEETAVFVADGEKAQRRPCRSGSTDGDARRDRLGRQGRRAWSSSTARPGCPTARRSRSDRRRRRRSRPPPARADKGGEK